MCLMAFYIGKNSGMHHGSGRYIDVDSHKETGMIELRLELQPNYENGESRNARRGPSPARSGGWLFPSPHSDKREVAFSRPALPRGSTALQEDALEFGAVRLRKFEF